MLRKHFALFVFIISNAMFVFVFDIKTDFVLIFEFLFCLVIDNFFGWGWGVIVFFWVFFHNQDILYIIITL